MKDIYLKFCPGCRNACSLDDPTCGIGEKFREQRDRQIEEDKKKAELGDAPRKIEPFFKETKEKLEQQKSY